MTQPTSTYRLQLTPDFGFAAAAGVVDYLADLGVSHLYLSPVLQAAPGSTHGYDVVDHGRLNVELGGPEAFAQLVTASRRRELSIVLDIVPNHMHIGPPDDVNAAWSDVVERGRTSPFAGWYDIDWEAPGADGRVLVPWRDPAGRLNYRRFFDIASLVGVRVEDAEVFAATHRVIVELTRAGVVSGLRVDHPDGLADPAEYLERLSTATGGCWVVVEKILESDERLPDDWRCAGSTGYDALNHILGMLVDPASEQALTELYQQFTGQKTDYSAVVDEAKRQVLRQSLSPEIGRLARAVTAELPIAYERAVDAVCELLVAMPVYRAYVTPGEPVNPRSAATLATARATAERARPDLADTISRVTELIQRGPRDLVIGFQQTCGPVMAKGVEDTAFYRYHRFAALNEVGGDPGTFGRTVDDFHAFCERLARDWPRTMTTLSTHDTKRGEDVRARLAVLSELPDEWADAVQRWGAAAAPYRSSAGPDRNLEYLLWQTLVGAWPITVERVVAYAEKASREAKEHTAWVNGDPAYDAAVRTFVEGVLGDPTIADDITRFVATLARPTVANQLGQKLVQLTMPGVPDVYQGSELVELALVDPDNRRPVDYELRRTRAAAGDTAKQRVVAAALHHRRDRPECYDAASYVPVHAAGPAAAHLIAFRRGDGAISLATRLPMTLDRAGGWRDTTLALPPGTWIDAVDGRAHRGGRVVDVAELLEGLPVALLGRTGAAAT